jgi:hypothetical protein
LEKSGKVDELAASTDINSMLAFTDEELRDAIKELNRSTDAYSKQMEKLKQQKDALGKLQKSKSKEDQSRSKLERDRIRAWDVERKTATESVNMPLSMA